ncbi:hypothetical protein K439DRAFT_318014 [Ramaria rubella]|nr:hypothetical protein K439DRAFT_318014 [Ramaria rubella]
MQMCSGNLCFNTVFHTAPFPTYENAQQMAIYYNQNAPVLPAPIPQAAPLLQPFYPYAAPSTQPVPFPPYPPAPYPLPLPYPQQPLPQAQPLTPAENGKHLRFLCQGQLCAKRKKPKNGAHLCRHKRCSKCCIYEAKAARLANLLHYECGAHPLPTAQQHPTPNTPLPPVPLPPAPAPIQPPAASGAHAQPAPIAAQPPPDTPQAAPEPPASAPGQRHLYMNGIGPLWAQAAMDSEKRGEAILSHKQDRRLLKTAHNRQVFIFIWDKPDKEPARFPHDVDTFPEFLLGAATQVVRYLTICEEDFVLAWKPEVRQWEMRLHEGLLQDSAYSTSSYMPVLIC